jgi:hypothetical protein
MRERQVLADDGELRRLSRRDLADNIELIEMGERR